MDFNFVMFHTCKCCSDSDLKCFSKLLYIDLIHTLSIRTFTLDSNLKKSLSSYFSVSLRTVDRAFEDLKLYGYIKEFEHPYIYKITNMNCQ